MTHKKKLCEDDLIHKENLRNIVEDGRFRVAIFWSARITAADFVYQEVAELAKRITKLDYDIVTGGGPGAMEAASWGHSLALNTAGTSRAIGINIELPWEQKINPYIDISATESTFSNRLDAFVLLSHVFIVTPGGIWTLLELFYTWQLMQVHHICRTPIILWGDQYAPLLDFINKEIVSRGYASKEDTELAVQVSTIEQVVELVKMAHENFENAGENACVNIHQYLAGAKRLGLI